MVRFEEFLEKIMADARADCPPLLADAMAYGVFPGGARVRPRLTLAVGKACGAKDPTILMTAAAAIEFLHCASLVHDDLPCFDNADLRRGKPSLHCAFGEELAVLAGDALIVLAFEALARGALRSPDKLSALVGVVGGAVGSRGGIVAGQAWESEAKIDLKRYHQAKTGALFAGATMAGAAAAGVAHESWRALGEQLGAAFQVADDIRDVAMSESELGKPVGQDAAHHRPNVAAELGVTGAINHLDKMIASAVLAIPECQGLAELRTLIVLETQRFLPKDLALSAA